MKVDLRGSAVLSIIINCWAMRQYAKPGHPHATYAGLGKVEIIRYEKQL